MNIGVDVDGVLADLGQFLRERGNDFFPKKYGLTMINPTASRIEHMFGCSNRQRRRFWWRCGASYIVKQPRMEGCAEVLRRLEDDGNNIVIITSRAMTTRRGPLPALLRHMLRSWLRKNGIVYSELVFCEDENSPEDKRIACMANHIDVMIDDSVENLLAVKECVTPICFDSPWNRELDEEGILRAYGWRDVQRLIEAM